MRGIERKEVKGDVENQAWDGAGNPSGGNTLPTNGKFRGKSPPLNNETKSECHLGRNSPIARFCSYCVTCLPVLPIPLILIRTSALLAESAFVYLTSCISSLQKPVCAHSIIYFTPQLRPSFACHCPLIHLPTSSSHHRQWLDVS